MSQCLPTKFEFLVPAQNVAMPANKISILITKPYFILVHYISFFLKNLAARQGVPTNEIPPPPPPPPPRSPSPPGSPNPSPVHPHSVGSDVGLKNHDPAFHVVAEGMFGGFFSATGSGATNFSLLLGNEIGPF